MKKHILLLTLLFVTPLYGTDLIHYADKTIQAPLTLTKPQEPSQFLPLKKEIDTANNQILEKLRTIKDANKSVDQATKQTIEDLQSKQNKILKQAKATLNTNDYALLQQTVEKQQTWIEYLLESWNSLSSYWQKYARSFFKDQVNSTNKYKNKEALVQQTNQLSDEEKSFIKNRTAQAKKGLSRFFDNQTIEPFTLGYVGPGGGYRAMILTSGYLKALEDLGLLDATMYISALSGSTWFLTPWIFFKGTVQSYQQTLLAKIKKNTFNPALAIFSQTDYIAPDYLYQLVLSVWPKFIFNQQLSSVDVYGSLLANVLLTNEQNSLHLTDQWNAVSDGRKPFPLYTSVCAYTSNNKQVYNWHEFSPLTITNLEFNLSFPVYAFGSVFDKGKSQEIAPQQSLGYLMGTFGSAYLLDLIDIKKICKSLIKESKNQGPDLASEYFIAATILNLVNVLPVWMNKLRVLPSETYNPYKNAPFANVPDGLKKDTMLTFVDGGIAYNIPVRPLLRPERNVGVIIIGDTSGNNPGPKGTPDELAKFFNDAQRVFNYTYKRVDDASTETLRLYKDPSHPQAPLIIYCNYVKDEKLLQKAQSDPQLKKIIDEGNLTKFDFNCTYNTPTEYCSFLYFGYTEAEFKQLSAIAEFNVKVNKDKIAKFLQANLAT